VAFEPSLRTLRLRGFNQTAQKNHEERKGREEKTKG